MCERLNCEIKRRARVVQVFPSAKSLIRLVGAVCCDQDDAWIGAKNFIDARSLANLERMRPSRDRPEERELARVAAAVKEAFDRKLRAA